MAKANALALDGGGEGLAVVGDMSACKAQSLEAEL